MFVSSPSNSSSVVTAIAIALVLLHPTRSFVLPQADTTRRIRGIGETSTSAVIPSGTARPTARPQHHATPTALSVATSLPTDSALLSLTLEKPLGLILEEADDGTGGVTVTEVNEGGSAFQSPYAEALAQTKLMTVEAQDVSSLAFDDVMALIISAPSPLTIEFATGAGAAADADAETGADAADVAAAPAYAVGTAVAIAVEQPASKSPGFTLEARVGDNLRKALLSHGDAELYRGLKKKLGNCGGGGQCGLCAVELVDDEGVWGERSEYEAQRIGNKGNEKCRLACMNNIVGPATVRTL